MQVGGIPNAVVAAVMVGALDQECKVNDVIPRTCFSFSERDSTILD